VSHIELIRVREAFDRVAYSLDSTIQRNPINAWMHASNLAVLRSAFPPGSRLLELGCGTGADAISLAKQGCQVFGFDLSQAMVETAREKASVEQVGDRVRFVQGRSRDLLEVVRESPWAEFDGAYANFTLTYEGDLRSLARAVAAVLKPGAFFICTLPNRLVLSELVIYAPMLRFGLVLWRFATPLLKEVHGSVLEIHAYSPWQVRDAFRGSFELCALVGVPTFLPPVYLRSQYQRLGGFGTALESLDARLAGRFPWNRLGEHTLFKFRRS